LASKLALLSILTIGILFAFSRAAWLNFVIGAFVMFCVLSLRRGGGRRAATFVVAGVSATAVLFAALAVTSSFTFLSERARFQTYDVQRFGAQLSGIELATKYPLGIGPGQFERISPISAHSTYVRALSEQGVLGLLVLLTLLLLTFAFAGRNAILGRDTYGIGSAALLAAWCGLLANSVFIDTLHWRHFWFLAALIWAGAARPGGGGPSSSAQSWSDALMSSKRPSSAPPARSCAGSGGLCPLASTCGRPPFSRGLRRAPTATALSPWRPPASTSASPGVWATSKSSWIRGQRMSADTSHVLCPAWARTRPSAAVTSVLPSPCRALVTRTVRWVSGGSCMRRDAWSVW